jgi:hypothetical protein
MSGLLSSTIRINCTLKISGFKAKKRSEKVGSKCVVWCPFAGNTLLLSAKDMFCQWVNNGRRMVHQEQHNF